MEQQQIIELLENFISGKDRSLKWAGKLEVMLDELYPDDDQIQDLVLALAAYNQGGGEYLYDEKAIFPQCKGALDRLINETSTAGGTPP